MSNKIVPSAAWMCMLVIGPVRFENSKEKIADASSPESRKLAMQGRQLGFFNPTQTGILGLGSP